MKIESKFNLVFKGDVYKTLETFIKQKQFKNIILILDKNLYKFNYTKKIILKLKNNLKIRKVYFYKEDGEPSYQYLDKQKKIFKKKGKPIFDLFICLGGGSTIDFTKGLAVMSTNSGKSTNYMGFPKLKNKPVPIIAIPTNCSTGSEVTYNAVFTDKRNKKKLGINSKLNYPILSIYDPKFLTIAPMSVVYFSACASLFRSIETYFSDNANAITKFFSTQSFYLITKNLKKALKKNKQACLNLQLGCMYSMQALTNSGSGPAGILTYMLSVNFNLPQAWTYAIIGHEFLKKNISLGFKDYKKILKKDSSIINFQKKINEINNISKKLKKRSNRAMFLNYKEAISKTLLERKSVLKNKNPINFKNKDINNISISIAKKLDRHF